MKDIRTLDFNLLKALDALLDECNVTRAAARLGVTQPAMSGMLTRLRDTFNDPLFVRAQRGIVPTSRALELAQPVRQVMQGIAALVQTAHFDPASASLTFTLAATDYALPAIAVPFLAALKQRAPHIRVSLVAVAHQGVHNLLERGNIDLALLTPESTPQDLHARTLFREHYVCVLREGHPAAQSPLTLEQFCQLDHALVSWDGDAFHGVTDNALARLGKQRRVTLSVQNFLVLPEILRASEMIAVVPSRLVANLPGLMVLPPPLEIAGFSKTAAWHERTHHDIAQRWLRGLLFEICAGRIA